MKASSGQWLVVESAHTGAARRVGRIVEALGEGGAPPFRVRWSDGGQEGLVYPGPDAHVTDDAPPPPAR